MIVWNVSPLFRGSWKLSPIHSVGRQTRDVWNGGPSLMRDGNGSTHLPTFYVSNPIDYISNGRRNLLSKTRRHKSYSRTKTEVQNACESIMRHCRNELGRMA